MLKMGFTSRLRLELQASRNLQTVTLGCYGLATVTWLITPAPWEVRILMAILALIAGYVSIYLQNGPASIKALDFHPESGWCYLSGDVWYEAGLCFPVFVTYWMVILRFRKPGSLPRSVVILSDSVNRTEFRLLRVRLLQLAHAKASHRKAV
ncbi:MAG: protein YgfX [Gammaproteobacteria bacterium]